MRVSENLELLSSGVVCVMSLLVNGKVLQRPYDPTVLFVTGSNLRRSNMIAFNRAKIRTLKMTIVIVSTFFLCWTPYNVMLLW